MFSVTIILDSGCEYVRYLEREHIFYTPGVSMCGV